ncbi:hypothetical protein AB0933_16120 [Streptomyces venezuelae]|uniref:hypothetical protein n=1 Tax=Streptomyces venezuelae TaxID=54571 RepID=UPI003455861D
MDLEKRPDQQVAQPVAPARPATPVVAAQPEGCLAVAIRIPVRIVVLVLVVPVRLLWDALAVCGTFLYRNALRPVGRAIGAVLTFLCKAVFVWPWVGLWRYVLVPVGIAIAWLVRTLIVVPAVWLYTAVLTPVGRGITTLLRWIFVVPLVALWRWVLAPIGRAIAVVAREIADAFGHAWRIAGHISLVVGRFLGTLLRWIFVEPVRWAYRTVLTPVGHVIRDVLWNPVAAAARSVGRTTRRALASARDTVRQARADVRRMLFGAPREAIPVARREPDTPETRTLGSSTTALMKD